MDKNQGQTAAEWQERGLLVQLWDKISAIGSMTVREATQQQVIKQYNKVKFPPDSEFTHPKHIPEEVTWCSVHLQGKECFIGFFDTNVFNIIFLDAEHKFWPSIKK